MQAQPGHSDIDSDANMKSLNGKLLSLALVILCSGLARADPTCTDVKPGVCPSPGIMCHLDPVPKHCQGDNECPDKQKCCRMPCSMNCTNPVNPVKPKPGECPEDNIMCLVADPAQCQNDGNCTGDLKCCHFHCGFKCVNATAVKPKPGECPPDNIRCSAPEPAQCQSDSNCSGDKKCCHFHCGLKCINATADKAGQCPKDDRICKRKDPDQCNNDGSCTGNQKCCNFHCGLKCKEPEPAPEKSGSCPLPPSYPTCDSFPVTPKNLCATDHECPDDQKCCQYDCSMQCKKPLQDKSGRCPPFNSSICLYARPAPAACSNDSQCEGTDRCCCHGNCRMECTRTVKPGACPAAKLPCTDNREPDNCTDDGDCTGRQKCCEGCGKHCTSPDPVKPGACPDIKAKCRLPLPKAGCKDDLDCGGVKKCCPMCANQCMNPASVRPGVCPVDRMLEQQCGTVLRNTCTSDGDCGDGEKCCLFGCGMQCVKALDVRPGSCPGIMAKCDPYKLNSQCQVDSDCEEMKKCCKFCGMTCLDAVPDHAGFCPSSPGVSRIECTTQITFSNCSNDMDCASDEKCCTSFCKKYCMKSVKEKSGICPATGQGQEAEYETADICNKCNDDKDCPENYKCCSGSKGKKCFNIQIRAIPLCTASSEGAE